MKREPAVEEYLAQAQSWELDRAKRSDRSKKVAWAVAIAATGLALVEGVALAGLTPLKQVQPFVIRVDNTTGLVDVVPEYIGTADPGELVTRTLLTQYVMSRERYFYGTAEADYELVAAMNTPQMNQAWAVQWDKSSPQSPINLYKDGTSVRPQIRAITFLKLGSGKVVAQVRFTKLARPGGTGDEQSTHWVTTVEYAYAKPSTDEKLRALNPLGFKVAEYQREPEVVTQASPKGGQ